VYERCLEAVRRETNGERALADVRALAGFHRIQASPGYDAAAAWLESAVRAAGYVPERVSVPADGRTRCLGFPMPEGWRCRHARATLHSARGDEPVAEFARAPLSIVQRSDSARGRWPLVVLESLDALEHTDVRGKVVLTGSPVQRVHERAVVAHGAVGVVSDGRRLMPPVRTAEHDRDSLAYTSFWWLADRPRGWGVVVSPARGAELRTRLAAGERIELEVDFDCERYTGEIPLLTTTLPGTLPGEILVTGHLCHPQPGANDNASGAAAVLETARVLAALAATGDLAGARRGVRFLWMPEFTGTYAWLAGDAQRAARTVAAINLDMVGEQQEDCGSTFLLEQAPHFLGSFADEVLARVRTAAQDWVKDFSGAGHYSLARLAEVPYSGGSDHALWLDPGAGVPCPMLIQWPDRYYHTDLDTPERCDPASLALAVRAAATYAGVLAGAGGEETRWILDLVARGARRRMLAALDKPRPWQAAHAEHERGQRALASVQRLAYGLEASHPVPRALERHLPLAADELEGFWDAEILPALPGVPPAPVVDPGRVPVREVAALVTPIRWLSAGWDALDESRRARFLALERSLPGGTTAVDLAWFACDGVRGVGDIAELITREGHEVTAAQIQEWFELAAAQGLCRWRDVDAPGKRRPSR
jgi:peptidase M28-like protein